MCSSTWTSLDKACKVHMALLPTGPGREEMGRILVPTRPFR